MKRVNQVISQHRLLVWLSLCMWAWSNWWLKGWIDGSNYTSKPVLNSRTKSCNGVWNWYAEKKFAFLFGKLFCMIMEMETCHVLFEVIGSRKSSDCCEYTHCSVLPSWYRCFRLVTAHCQRRRSCCRRSAPRNGYQGNRRLFLNFLFFLLNRKQDSQCEENFLLILVS